MGAILSRYSHIDHHFLPQKSRSLARNYLVEGTTCELIAFVDADVVLERDWLNHCIKTIGGSNIAATGGSIYREGKEFLDGVRRRISEVICQDFNFLESKGGGLLLNTAATLIKKKALIGVGLFDPTLIRSEDSDFTRRLLLKGYYLASAPEARARVTRSDNFLAYLFWRPLVVGYFQGKIDHRYQWPRISFMRRWWWLGRSYLGDQVWKQLACNLVVLGIMSLVLLGELVGYWRFRGRESAVVYQRRKLVRFLSSQGDIYCLNPDLVVCLRKEDVLVMNEWSGGVLEGESADILRRAIYQRLVKNASGDAMNFLMANGIVAPLQKMSAAGEEGMSPQFFASREVAKEGELFNQQV